jgi:hypothetical protein
MTLFQDERISSFSLSDFIYCLILIKNVQRMANYRNCNCEYCAVKQNLDNLQMQFCDWSQHVE